MVTIEIWAHGSQNVIREYIDGVLNWQSEPMPFIEATAKRKAMLKHV
jgi:hypothetical protein